MGMIDEIIFEYPLPLAGANNYVYETSDMPCPMGDVYKVDKDRQLWREEYDTEDRSIAGKWEREHPGQQFDYSEMGTIERLQKIAGCMTRTNQRWVKVSDFSGEIDAVQWDDDGAFVGWRAAFSGGKMVGIIPFWRRVYPVA